MEYTSLGRTALHISKISYGTWQFSAQNAATSEKHLTQETLRAIEAIIRDTIPIGSSAPE